MDLVAIGLKLKGLEIVPSAFDGFAQAPLSSRGACATAFVLYLVVLAVVKSAGLSPMRLRSLFFVHNALLSLASAALLAAFISQLAPMLLESGIDFAICSPRAFTRTLEWLYYLNYLFKYYELLDTVFRMYLVPLEPLPSHVPKSGLKGETNPVPARIPPCQCHGFVLF